VLIPPGTATIGRDDGPQNARPARRIALSAFRIDRCPVTGSEWLSFLRATDARPPRHWCKRQEGWHRREVIDLAGINLQLPVTNITWAEARAFAEWCDARLPGEAEWEKAARDPDGRLMPWGSDPQPLALLAAARRAAEQASGATQSVSLPTNAEVEIAQSPRMATPLGLLGLIGPVWEWCEDAWCENAYADFADIDPRGPSAGDTRVIRGGYDPALKGSGFATFRHFLRADIAHPRVGLRCLRPV
jgi:formylglycine-generating enzyme required for sulfatase activity